MVSLIENTGSLTPCTITILPPRFLNAERSVELAIIKSSADLVNVSDSAVNLAASLSKSIESRYASPAAPVEGVGVGGVVNIPDTAALPRPAMIDEFTLLSYAPNFQARQPWLYPSPALPPIPRSQAQSAYNISPFELEGPL